MKFFCLYVMQEGVLPGMVEARYASYTQGLGQKIRAGKVRPGSWPSCMTSCRAGTAVLPSASLLPSAAWHSTVLLHLMSTSTDVGAVLRAVLLQGNSRCQVWFRAQCLLTAVRGWRHAGRL